MRKLMLVGMLVCSLAWAADPEPQASRDHKKLWWISVAALGVASILDAQSSWGRQELNPLLRSSDGRFGARGVVVKTSIMGGITVLEWLGLRRDRKLAAPLAVGNASVAAWTGGVAIRNHRQ